MRVVMKLKKQSGDVDVTVRICLQDVDCSASACDRQVDILDVGEVVGVGTIEEGVRSNQWSDEGCYTVPALAELQSACGGCWVANNGCVRVGRGFQGGQTASNDELQGDKC